jgi:hypothetical protein
MDKESLLKQCKELGIKGVSKLNKAELLEKIKEVKQETQPKPLPNYLLELHQQIPKDIVRRVCKQCGELNHGISSTLCKVNILKKDLLKQKVKQFFLLQDGSDDSLHFESACNQLGISMNQCKEMYSEIPWLDLLQRPNRISSIVEQLTFTRCEQCNQPKCAIQPDSLRTWKDKKICDKCFAQTMLEREEMWKLISNYKLIQCSFCNIKKESKEDRFQYDHINMFDKEESVCTMVMDGFPIEQIYQEIDKCQILCDSCHAIVTHIERALGFTQEKRSLTRKLNLNEITKEEHEIQLHEYQKVYNEIMLPIYETIKQKHFK